MGHPVDPDAIRDRLEAVRALITRAEAEAHRPSGSVTLIAVTKTVEAARIRPLLEAGHRVFGENRVQEAEAKWPRLREDYPDIELHLIGPLQSNKARVAVALFNVIQTIDRDKIAAALAAEMSRQKRMLKLLIEVNTGEEPQKAGIAPSEVPAFIQRCRGVHGLALSGLMCIPPQNAPPAPHFALLDTLATKAGLGMRSMGMSADFITAIHQGATHVRIGSALFGSRPPGP